MGRNVLDDSNESCGSATAIDLLLVYGQVPFGSAVSHYYLVFPTFLTIHDEEQFDTLKRKANSGSKCAIMTNMWR